VVEGRGGEDGHLRVFSRYVVLPGGRRINIPANLAGPASPRALDCRRARSESQAQNPAKTRSERVRKKFMAGAGTTRQHRR
jgi:hypothetical protein